MVFTPRGLMVTSVVVGAVAVATLALSVATDAWLFTTETMEHPENKTVNMVIKAQMGLWKVCLNTGGGQKLCESYDAVHTDTERVESQQTSFAIMRATRVAAMFPVVALVMITIAVILGIIGNIRRDIKTLLAAVISILGGLTLAVGIIFYISAINDEVGHRTKGKEGKQFEYEYGWSFFFAGMAFMIAEGTAVVFVTQFMQRNATTDDMVRIIPGLEDKLESTDKDENDDGATNPTIVM
ncbi:voltage-dependent calcium channel gamma-5 subunit-like isoform X2 [Mercenaria mercenaria]|uniref:voltage-dependent calcium channel gamma-5 subunit-like isoform X2 n=1 Tax=Mercenaria mercenaria TaxID=6596 RepID=UPI00234E613A|nr:voltage-dependent calcium channel gamma-5 subunit-like isoform X2 [Mercenaria mercenaria]